MRHIFQLADRNTEAHRQYPLSGDAWHPEGTLPLGEDLRELGGLPTRGEKAIRPLSRDPAENCANKGLIIIFM